MTELNKYERETIICYNEGDDEASVYTCNRALRNKLAKLAENNPDCKPERVCDESVSYIVPKSWVKITRPRVLSDEQKQAAAARIRKSMGYDESKVVQ